MSEEDARPGSGPSEEAEYFRRIEERFCALRGDPMLLSPRDWSLMARWWADRVPLPLILESLEEIFASRSRRGEEPGDVHSLGYVGPEVRRRWKVHRELFAPRRSESEATGRLRTEVRRHLGRVARRLREAGGRARERGQEALARALLTAAAEVRSIRRDAGRPAWEPRKAETVLESLDGELLVAARSTLEPADRSQLEREVASVISPRREKMSAHGLQESRAALEARLLRIRLGIPRISLLADG